jgi:hypothetical protein
MDCIVAFAAESGSVAFEAPPGMRNSCFTAALLECILARGHLDDMRALLQDHVRGKVVSATGGAQVPWVTTSMDSAQRRHIVQHASSLPLSPGGSGRVTIGDVAVPLLRTFQEQVGSSSRGRAFRLDEVYSPAARWWGTHGVRADFFFWGGESYLEGVGGGILLRCYWGRWGCKAVLLGEPQLDLEACWVCTSRSV